MSFYNVSATAGDNTTVGGISSVGSAKANLIDDLIRQLAAQDKQFLLDLGGGNTVGGTADAITVTPASNPGGSGAITAAFDAMHIVIRATGTNTVTNPTLAVGSLGAEPIKKASHGSETALAIGDIQSGGTYWFNWRSSWDSGGGAWELIQLSAGAGSYTTTTAATSGTEVAFTGIPTSAEVITLLFDSVSLDGTGGIRIQLGDSGGYETTGYLGGYTQLFGSTATMTDVSDGAGVIINGASRTLDGEVTIRRFSATKWKIRGSFHIEDGSTPAIDQVFSSKTLSGTLDRVRVIPTGSDNFDGSGSIKIIY